MGLSDDTSQAFDTILPVKLLKQNLANTWSFSFYWTLNIHTHSYTHTHPRVHTFSACTWASTQYLQNPKHHYPVRSLRSSWQEPAKKKVLKKTFSALCNLNTGQKMKYLQGKPNLLHPKCFQLLFEHLWNRTYLRQLVIREDPRFDILILGIFSDLSAPNNDIVSLHTPKPSVVGKGKKDTTCKIPIWQYERFCVWTLPPLGSSGRGKGFLVPW